MSLLSINFQEPAAKQEPPETVTKRDIYFFECKICHKRRRQTLKSNRANDGICRKCRNDKPNPNQLNIFNMTQKNNQQYTPDTPLCPECGANLVPIWQNNGWDGEQGPRRDEITGYKCPNCGHQE